LMTTFWLIPAMEAKHKPAQTIKALFIGFRLDG